MKMPMKPKKAPTVPKTTKSAPVATKPAPAIETSHDAMMALFAGKSPKPTKKSGGKKPKC